MRLASSCSRMAGAGALLAALLALQSVDSFYLPVGRRAGLAVDSRKAFSWEGAATPHRVVSQTPCMSSAVARPSRATERDGEGGGARKTFSSDENRPYPPRTGSYQPRGGGGPNSRGAPGGQRGGGGGKWNNNNNNNKWNNNNSQQGPVVLLTGAKLLVKADRPRPDRPDRPERSERREYTPREGGGGRGGGGGYRGEGGSSFSPRGAGGDRSPMGGGRGRFGGGGGPDLDLRAVPVVPDVVDTIGETRRKKEKEKKESKKDFGKKGKGGKRFDDSDFDGDADLEMRYGNKKRRGGKGRNQETGRGPKVVVIDEATITIQQLSEKMDVRAGEVIKYLMVNLGVMATITQSIDAETAVKVATAFGKEIAREGGGEADEDDEFSPSVQTKGTAWIDDDPATLQPRAPVVTIMGHVDHGKTSLLDAIRETSVVAGEAGGITQHIGAYQVQCNNKPITFIDTPGHAAFSEMRARGANVTDMVVLVVAADEGVKEQTVEAIKCAKQANVPVLVAVNKVDKPGADIQRVQNELMKYDLLMEEYGGDVLSAPVSAKKRIGLDDLLEKILLQAEVLDLKANPDRAAQGTVVDARMEKGLGPVTTVLVQRGTLKVGDCIVAGTAYGKVRSLTDERGSRIESAGPSSPAVVSGWDGVPAAGDIITVVENEMVARGAAEARRKLARERTGVEMSRSMQAQVMSIFGTGGDGTVKERKELTVVIKADVQGSAEALATSLGALKAEDDRCEVVVKILQSGVGDVTQSDVSLASVSKATIIAFNVAADNPAMEEARKTLLEIEYYSVIYDVIDKIEALLKQILSPTPDGEFVGAAVVKQVFEIGKVGKVAGCEVTEGLVRRGGIVRILRGTEIIFRGALKTLRSVKSDVMEMKQGQDCGMSFAGFEDFQEGDVVECYMVEKKKKDD